MGATRRSAAQAAARPFASALPALDNAKDYAWLLLWVALVPLPLVLRGPLPPDELRYLSVAWEMWNRGDLVLPYLNGAPYTDKGPLLFWLMHAGWAVFGVNDWWPRLLPALFALVAVLLTRSLALVLWPANRSIAAFVPWLLIGTLAFAVYTQTVLVDLLLTCCTLLAILGMARAERGEGIGWLLVAVGTALGLLTKGPVVLLHLAGPALLAPWWRRAGRGPAARAWYPRVGGALACGMAAALAWAAVAIGQGDAAYGTNVLMYQTAGRIAGNFGHARPFWFYLAILPVLLFPWTAWPAAWRAVRDALRAEVADRAWRFIAAAIVPALIGFSLMNSKQPHYVLPLVPLLVCLLASALATQNQQRESARVPLLLAASAMLLIAALPLVAGGRLTVEPWSPLPGLVAAVALLALAGRSGRSQLARRLAVLTPVIVLASQLAFFSANRAAYDTSPAAAFVRALQDEGHPIAYTRDYEGEFHFPGRLTVPLDVIGPQEEAAAAWSRQHPDGYLVRYADAAQPGAAYSQRLRGGWLSIERAQP